MPDLKPCPLCGSTDVELEIATLTWDRGAEWRIRCNDCGIELGAFPIKQTCIKRWNERQNETTTDTARLDWLCQFFRVEDVGDECVCPGMTVNEDAVSRAFDYGALRNERITLTDGWINPDMRRAIDAAIAHCAEAKPCDSD